MVPNGFRGFKWAQKCLSFLIVNHLIFSSLSRASQTVHLYRQLSLPNLSSKQAAWDQLTNWMTEELSWACFNFRVPKKNIKTNHNTKKSNTKYVNMPSFNSFKFQSWSKAYKISLNIFHHNNQWSSRFYLLSHPILK